VTDLLNVERAGNREQDAMLPFYRYGLNCRMHTVDHFENEG